MTGFTYIMEHLMFLQESQTGLNHCSGARGYPCGEQSVLISDTQINSAYVKAKLHSF